ncbi:TPA: hypothetical protein QCY70_004941 [Bacillus cereus]|uniref:hypothetical protein n=2 Tax=Bacillus cereus group TaxID=86661 RepID=UPI0032FEC57B|nr:hypothetical protein [Bacillus cereus]HDR8014973.1 hypothetical protein [Bacillus cereus]
MISIRWEQSAHKQVAEFNEFHSKWDHMNRESAQRLAKMAEEYFKPMLNVRSHRTGQTERSIEHKIKHGSDGFEIEYHGLLSALYMDEGNFPAGQTLQAPRGAAQRAFPVDSRFGSPAFSPTIHGMGSLTPGAPTHWSEKTVEYLAEGPGIDVLLHEMDAFLRQVVIT